MGEWSEAERLSVLESLAVACEITGTELSMPARRFILGEIEREPAQVVLGALQSFARAADGRLTLGALREQIDARRAALRPRSSYEICGHSEGTVALVLAEAAAGRALQPWQSELLRSIQRERKALR